MTTFSRTAFIALLILLLFPAFASAAELRMKTSMSSIRVGDTFTVGVSLNTQKERINALDGKLIFSHNLKLSGIRLEGSLIPLWITFPTEEMPGTVSFAGILPGGYESQTTQKVLIQSHGNIFTLVFTAISSGIARVAFGSQTSAYLNDGNGTHAQLATPALTFSIGTSDTTKRSSVVPIDTTPPEPFTPVITSGKPFGYVGKVLVFVAQDKGTGILRYEIARSYIKNADLSKLSWQEVKSPYKLLHSDSDKYLFVRAIDKAYNIRVGRVSPQHISVNALLHQWWVWVLVIFAVSVILFGIIKRYLYHS